MIAKDKSFFTEWLEKIQQESWQLELLISGFVIFGLFEMQESLELYVNRSKYVDLNGPIFIYFGIVLGIIIIGIKIFLFNLLIHVGVRGLWIGAIGLRYVSGDIDYEQLNYSPPFKNFYKKSIGSFDDYIEKLEKFSSLIFSYSFLLFFIFLSGFVFLLFIFSSLLLLTEVSAGRTSVNNAYEVGFHLGRNIPFAIFCAVFTILHLLLGILVFIDFMSFGFFKERKGRLFSKTYFWVYRYFGWITLSFLYRPLLLNFLDNSYTKRFLLLSIPYGFLVAVFIPEIGYENKHFFPSSSIFEYDDVDNASLSQALYQDEYYEDAMMKLDEKEYPFSKPIVSIPSKIVSQNVLELYIKLSTSFDTYIELNCPSIKPFQKKGIFTIFSSPSPMSKDYEDDRELLDARIDAKREYFKETYPDSLERHSAFFAYNDSLRQPFEDSIINFRVRNLEKIKRIALERIFVSIDTMQLSSRELSCDLYEHPRSGNAGLLCHVDLINLPRGKHEVVVDQLHYNQSRDTFLDKTIRRQFSFFYDKDE